MKRQSFQFLLSSMLACLLVLGMSQSGSTQSSALPEVIQRCVEEGVQSVGLVGTARESSQTFYYLRNYLFGIDTPLESWYSLIAVNSRQPCTRLMDGPSELTPLSQFMTTATARELELERYRHEIAAAGSQAAFEQELNEQLSPAPYTAFEGLPIYLSEEQVWALRQLGIQFPDTYRLLTSTSTRGR